MRPSSSRNRSGRSLPSWFPIHYHPQLSKLTVFCYVFSFLKSTAPNSWRFKPCHQNRKEELLFKSFIRPSPTLATSPGVEVNFAFSSRDCKPMLMWGNASKKRRWFVCPVLPTVPPNYLRFTLHPVPAIRPYLPVPWTDKSGSWFREIIRPLPLSAYETVAQHLEKCSLWKVA